MRIKKIGICGSDIHVYHGKHQATPFPVVQGHEYSVIVETVGKSVVKVSPGKKATGKNVVVSGAGPIGNFVVQFEKSEVPEKY